MTVIAAGSKCVLALGRVEEPQQPPTFDLEELWRFGLLAAVIAARFEQRVLVVVFPIHRK